ncbi:hypothetical protein OQA88_4844 [Cercophora sp. LCS_1]
MDTNVESATKDANPKDTIQALVVESTSAGANAEDIRQVVEAATKPKVKQLAANERQRADKAKEKATLFEYIDSCHELVFSKLRIQTDRRLSASATSPNVPDNAVFGRTGGSHVQTTHWDEISLEYVLYDCVEYPVRAIIDHLQQLPADHIIQQHFDLGDGIIFENHPLALSELSSEMRIYRAGRAAVEGNSGDDDESGYRAMVYICEYKPPQLTAAHLRLGLRPMHIPSEVIHRGKLPADVDPDTEFAYYADLFTASAVTQTYHYMIEAGLEYGMLTTGVAIVFLHIDWQDAATLHYHLAEPSSEVAAHSNQATMCTAVGQYLTFTLMAVGAPGQLRTHQQEERRNATAGLETWCNDLNIEVQLAPKDGRKPPITCSPAWEPTTYKGIDRSPYLLRSKPHIPAPDRDPSRKRLRTPDSSGDESGPPLPDTPVARRARASTRLSQTEPATQQQQQRQLPKERRWQHCTQRCLLGLVRGTTLDPACPNVRWHDKNNKDNHHAIDHATFLQLLRKQLIGSLDHGIVPLGKGGARGVLFRVTLLAYGYTIVGKGTVRAFVRDLEHEADVYARLQPLQGVVVPVFLGAIDLRSMDKIYYYDHRVYIIHITFLSWGGFVVDSRAALMAAAAHTQTTQTSKTMFEEKMLRALQAAHGQGIAHQDVRTPNMLYNPETGNVMLIDFERALLLAPPLKRPLGHEDACILHDDLGVDNVCGECNETGEADENVSDGSQSPARGRRMFADEMRAARSVFWGEAS